jgi:SNF2 family DNA or RNA helicase
MDNWMREFGQWCPEARVLPYISGDDSKSRPICRDLEFFYEISKSNKQNQCMKDVKIPKFNVLLTSYHFLV